MLVLSRKNGQKIMIGDDIEIVIVESSCNNVKIGIEAPKSISVYREEIWKEIKEANKTANQTERNALDELTNIIQKRPAEMIGKTVNHNGARVIIKKK